MQALRAIADRAAQANLPFLLAGGHAVIAHGYPRSTFDIDLIILRSDTGRWVELVAALGYAIHHQGPTFIHFTAADPKSLPLDLMTVNHETFEKLRVAAVPGTGASADVKIVSLLHLLALKCHAIKHGHSGRLVKDADDVIRLVQINRMDMNDPEVREMFLKYGTDELYEKVKRVSD